MSYEQNSFILAGVNCVVVIVAKDMFANVVWAEESRAVLARKNFRTLAMVSESVQTILSTVINKIKST